MRAPPDSVIRGFGGDVRSLTGLGGGQGTSWRAGDIFLKPAGREDELTWIAHFVGALDVGTALRVARYLRCSDGSLVCGGWMATEWLDGQHHGDRWSEKLAVSKVFHDAAARSTAEWPDFMEERGDPWSRATRAAWGEEALPPMPSAARNLVNEMLGFLKRSGDASPFQVIHSDLAGNVLFADELSLPPAVIDMSPQLRSVAYADAILIADAVAWNGAPLVLAEAFIDARPERRADLARAVIFRVATAALFPGVGATRVVGEADGYRRLLPALVRP